MKYLCFASLKKKSFCWCCREWSTILWLSPSLVCAWIVCICVQFLIKLFISMFQSVWCSFFISSLNLCRTSFEWKYPNKLLFVCIKNAKHSLIVWWKTSAKKAYLVVCLRAICLRVEFILFCGRYKYLVIVCYPAFLLP